MELDLQVEIQMSLLSIQIQVEEKVAIKGNNLEISTSKMSRFMEVDVIVLEAGGAKKAVVECKETMMQVAVLTAIIVEN